MSEEHMGPATTKKKPQTPQELEQALILEQSRVAALQEELAAVRIQLIVSLFFISLITNSFAIFGKFLMCIPP